MLFTLKVATKIPSHSILDPLIYAILNCIIFQADSSPAPPPEKKIKLETATPPAATGETKQPTTVTPPKKTEFVPIAPRKSPIPIAPAPSPAGTTGTLKLKTFSKMNVKNQLSGENGKNKTNVGEDSGGDAVTGDNKTAPKVMNWSQDVDVSYRVSIPLCPYLIKGYRNRFKLTLKEKLQLSDCYSFYFSASVWFKVYIIL